MLTRKRWVAPIIPANLDPAVTQYLQSLNKSISDYWLSLEGKNSLTIDEAYIRAAQGVAFPASNVVSSDVNTLDDYERGTWTPSVGGNATYTTQAGSYTKIGRVVIIRANLNINAIGTGSTGVISGLPFTATETTPIHVGYWAGSATNYTYMAGYIGSGTTTINLTATAAAAAAVTDPAPFFKNGANIYLGGAYIV